MLFMRLFQDLVDEDRKTVHEITKRNSKDVTQFRNEPSELSVSVLFECLCITKTACGYVVVFNHL